jgi:hypothetical protein
MIGISILLITGLVFTIFFICFLIWIIVYSIREGYWIDAIFIATILLIIVSLILMGMNI